MPPLQPPSPVPLPYHPPLGGKNCLFQDLSFSRIFFSRNFFPGEPAAGESQLAVTKTHKSTQSMAVLGLRFMKRTGGQTKRAHKTNQESGHTHRASPPPRSSTCGRGTEPSTDRSIDTDERREGWVASLGPCFCLLTSPSCPPPPPPPVCRASLARNCPRYHCRRRRRHRYLLLLLLLLQVTWSHSPGRDATTAALGRNPGGVPPVRNLGPPTPTPMGPTRATRATGEA